MNGTSTPLLESQGRTFDLDGGRVSLDFVNTVGGLRGSVEREYLARYGDLLDFALQTGTVTSSQARGIAEEARRRPEAAATAVEEARRIREALHRVFTARAGGLRPERADLDLLNGALARALSHRRLDDGEQCCLLGWDVAVALDAPWWPIVADAADLLASPDDLARVRVCGMSEAGECGWLFVDRTKARTRRWCSMDDCGNRAKARRHYAKVKAGR